MNDIDPVEFGRLQAQVETLIASDAAKTVLLEKMASAMAQIQLQLAEAKGGWHQRAVGQQQCRLRGAVGGQFGAVGDRRDARLQHGG